MRGERIDVIVGPENKKYRIPQKLLCESSNVFDELISKAKQDGEGHVDLRRSTRYKEGETVADYAMDFHDHEKQVPLLNLRDDPVEYFELILDYMMSGKIATDAVKASAINHAMIFMQYANKYELPGACDAVHDEMKIKLADNVVVAISEDVIQSFFQMTVPGSPLRTLIVQAALSYKGLQAVQDYSNLESTVEGYANELLFQIRQCLETMVVKDGLVAYKDILQGSITYL